MGDVGGLWAVQSNQTICLATSIPRKVEPTGSEEIAPGGRNSSVFGSEVAIRTGFCLHTLPWCWLFFHRDAILGAKPGQCPGHGLRQL